MLIRAFVSQTYAVIRFLWNYAIPLCVFGYCYVRIFHAIRHQKKVSHASHVPMATTSRDHHVDHQAPGAKLSRSELNVLQTMVGVILCFVVCWSVYSIANFFKYLGVSAFDISYNLVVFELR